MTTEPEKSEQKAFDSPDRQKRANTISEKNDSPSKEDWDY